jgi:hypothetical protein
VYITPQFPCLKVLLALSDKSSRLSRLYHDTLRTSDFYIHISALQNKNTQHGLAIPLPCRSIWEDVDAAVTARDGTIIFFTL